MPSQTVIAAFVKQGVITGKDIHLQEDINRAEAAAIIVRSQPDLRAAADVLRASPSGLPLFPDVQEGSWYTPYVEVAFQQGIMRGFLDGTFRPATKVSVSMASAMALRAKGEKVSVTPGEVVGRAVDLGWLPKNLRSSPRAPITRGDFLSLLHSAGILGASKESRLAPVSSVNSSSKSSSKSLSQAIRTSVVPGKSSKNFALSIPALQIVDVSIIHPANETQQKSLLSVLNQGLGHLLTYPGEGGKIMIYGHSSGYPWDVSKYTKIFRTIHTMSIGDKIYVTYNGKLFTYTVALKQTVKANDMKPFLGKPAKEELILYTCWPLDSIAERYLVHAVLTSQE